MWCFSVTPISRTVCLLLSRHARRHIVRAYASHRSSCGATLDCLSLYKLIITKNTSEAHLHSIYYTLLFHVLYAPDAHRHPPETPSPNKTRTVAPSTPRPPTRLTAHTLADTARQAAGRPPCAVPRTLAGSPGTDSRSGAEGARRHDSASTTPCYRAAGGGARHVPDLPPVFSSRRTSRMTMPLEAALHMS